MIRGRYGIYLRILTLVDEMAPLRRGVTSSELTQRINDRLGETYSVKTIHRDLIALHETGYVQRQHLHAKNARLSDVWTLNLSASENLQYVSLKQL